MIKKSKIFISDSTKNVLELVATKLNVTSALEFLENNLNYLISEWHSHNYNLKFFPFFLLNCSSEIEFYTKYTNIVFPMLFVNNSPLLDEICKHHQKTIEEVAKVSLCLI